MKKYSLVLLFFFTATICSAQLFKKLGDKIKNEAEWRAQHKVGQKVDQSIDSLFSIPKKVKNKNKSKTGSTDNTGTEKQNNTNNSNTKPGSNNNSPNGSLNASANEADDMIPKDGFISLKLSADRVFAGGSITMTGESVNYKKFNQVEITVSGPSANDVKSIPLAADGKYIADWNASDKAGEYIVTAKSSDKKAQQSAHFTVYTLPQMSNWADDNIAATNKAYEKLEAAVAKVEGSISPKNKGELDKKMGELKDNVDDVLKLFKDLNTAGKETGNLVKSAKSFPPNLSGNLSDLNNNLADHARQMKTFERMTEHEPQDNTICEYLVMVNEACAAFSTFTNFYSKSISTILLNITLDKGVPKAVDIVNSNGMQIVAPNDFIPKEIAKIYSTSKFDAQSLTKKMGKAGIAGDLIQYASDVLLKTYCGVFGGNFTHDYSIDHRNKKGEIWWSYGFGLKATLTLRYPKKDISPTVIKMKGNLEGNATNFSFFEDVEKEESFHEGSKGKIEVIPIKTFIPYSVSFATSERDIMGFGAIARGLATPAYFNIPIDAEYDVDADKIKFFINPAIIDFTDLIANQFVFLLVGGDLLPYIKKMNFPISKARLTINSVVKDHNEFAVEKDAKGNLSFSGKGHKHIGSPADEREHDLNFSISAKKQ